MKQILILGDNFQENITIKNHIDKAEYHIFQQKIHTEKLLLPNPDVLLIDVREIEKEILTSIQKYIRTIPSIVIVNDSKKSIDAGIYALDLGAKDVLESKKVQTELHIKLQAVVKLKERTTLLTKSTPLKTSFQSRSKKIVVIAASTGGPQTLEKFLTDLPGNIPVPILIVQHMPPVFTKSFAERINTISEIEVREAKEGDVLQNGVALIAPGGKHMEIIAEIQGMEGEIKLNEQPPEESVRPCANKLFVSASKIFTHNTIGIVFTGMGKDGSRGAEEIKKNKGTILAESKESAIIYGMPKEVIERDLADVIAPVDKMAVALLQLLDV